MTDDSEDARLANDGHIDGMVHTSAPAEYFFRSRTKLWIVADFDRAIARCETLFSGNAKIAEREQRCVILRSLRKERIDQDALEQAAERERVRHGELLQKIASIAQPRWITYATFAIVVLTLIMAVMASFGATPPVLDPLMREGPLPEERNEPHLPDHGNEQQKLTDSQKD